MTHVKRNAVATISLTATGRYANPFRATELTATFTSSQGRAITVPGFWDGGDSWRVRFAWPEDEVFTYATSSSDPGLNAQSGTVTVQGANHQTVFTREGPVTIARDQRHFAHKSGAPFAWLGDTWWMGLTRRLPLDGFRQLIQDRVAKGFTVIQIIAGLYPDMDWYDERGEGDAGYPWDREFNAINPAYFQQMDRRLSLLVEAGLMPCVVGFWGYFMDFAGAEVLRLHWRNLIARYGAWPVAWCVAGEGLMPYYVNRDEIEDMDAWLRTRAAAWSDMARWLRRYNGLERPITIHPTQFGRQQVDDPTTLDFEMLQTGHGGFPALTSTIDMLEASIPAAPTMPVIISEVNYEGILESSGPEIQRFLYWSSFLSGSSGFTYGANGLWQVNGDEIPYGTSPHGMAWGGPSWQDASQLGGSRQIGLAKQLLDAYPWWTVRPTPRNTTHHASSADRIGPYAAVLDGDIRIVFIPAPSIFLIRNEGFGLLNLNPETQYDAYYFNPKSGERTELGLFRSDADGGYVLPTPYFIQDWVFVAQPAQ